MINCDRDETYLFHDRDRLYSAWDVCYKLTNRREIDAFHRHRLTAWSEITRSYNTVTLDPYNGVKWIIK